MSDSSSSVEDIIAQTDEDYFSGNFCYCGHLMSIHTNGNLIKICHALSYNGLVWSACKCKNPKPIEFEIEVEIEKFEIEVEIDANELHKLHKFKSANSSETGNQVQLTAFKEI